MSAAMPSCKQMCVAADVETHVAARRLDPVDLVDAQETPRVPPTSPSDAPRKCWRRSISHEQRRESLASTRGVVARRCG